MESSVVLRWIKRAGGGADLGQVGPRADRLALRVRALQNSATPPDVRRGYAPPVTPKTPGAMPPVRALPAHSLTVCVELISRHYIAVN